MKKSSSIALVEKEAAKVGFAVATSDSNVYCNLVCIFKDRAQCTHFGVEL